MSKDVALIVLATRGGAWYKVSRAIMPVGKDHTMATITFEVPDSIKRKIAGHEFTLDFAAMAGKPHAGKVFAWQFLYGTRGLNDAANAAKSLATDKGAHPDKWTLADSRAYLDAWEDGTIADKVSRGNGASVFDPVTEEMRRLAMAEIIARLDVKGWKECAEHPKGAKYVKVTEKGNLSRQTEALDDYISRADAAQPDETKRFRARAEVIVAARSTEPANVEVEL